MVAVEAPLLKKWGFFSEDKFMTQVVANQYSKWVYPLPIDDMHEAINSGKYWEIGDPILYRHLFWPHRRDLDSLNILVAGCGTNQAAYYACRNPNWNVLGVDLSDSSLAHQEALKRKHNLSNLRLKKLNLLEVTTLGETFDFVTSTGVLHHLPDPDAGLVALKKVLRPQGVMNLMLYGTSLRLGVYLMQEVFRLLNFQQTQADVDLVRETIDTLPADHVVKRYTSVAHDLHYDAGIVDTFLHPVDRSYYVKDIFQFARRAGLEFLTWCDPGEYSLELQVPATHPLWPHLRKLDRETAAHVCDLLTLSRGTHRFALGHPEYVKTTLIDFDNDNFFDHTVVQHRSFEVVRLANLTEKKNAIVKRGDIVFELEPRLAYLMSKMDNQINIRQAIDSIQMGASERNATFELARHGFKALWERGHIHLLKPPL